MSSTIKLTHVCSQSPSVYVVFESIKASDGCKQIGPTFADKTLAFAPGVLSTVVDGTITQSFNFGDLPCPPATVQWDPAKPYAPVIAPPPGLFSMDPAFSSCIPGRSQGIDPPIPISTANGVSGPEPGVGPHPRLRRALAHAYPHAAHVVPRAPQRTA